MDRDAGKDHGQCIRLLLVLRDCHPRSSSCGHRPAHGGPGYPTGCDTARLHRRPSPRRVTLPSKPWFLSNSVQSSSLCWLLRALGYLRYCSTQDPIDATVNKHPRVERAVCPCCGASATTRRTPVSSSTFPRTNSLSSCPLCLGPVAVSLASRSCVAPRCEALV